MSINAKPFQQATILAALKALKKVTGPKRFLVADEVGLGKTIVGSGVIQGLAKVEKNQDKQIKDGLKPFTVLYVCSNLGIAKQNVSRLLSFLDEKERKLAISRVDRPSLLVTAAKPKHECFHIYSLTPATAIPTRKGQRQDGLMKERALAMVLLQLIVNIEHKLLQQVFRRNAAKKTFDECVMHFRKQEQAGQLGGNEFRLSFRTALRETLGLKAGQQLPARINSMLGSDLQQSDLVGAVRTALTIAGLDAIKPSLVIFDEFQRFRDLTDANDDKVVDNNEFQVRLRDRAEALVLKHIRGNADSAGPALLLLSATPYTPYRRRSESKDDGENQNSDFFDLVGFLAGNAKHAKNTKKLFDELSEELRKGLIDTNKCKELRRLLIANLSPLMSRSERAQLAETEIGSLNDDSMIEAELLPCDIEQFCQMQQCFIPDDKKWILPLWQSVPLPMQTLGSRYLPWKNSKAPKQVILTRSNRNKYKLPKELPHPSLRALLDLLSGSQMILPWSAPSLPWWSLGNGWKPLVNTSHLQSKLLVFSRYRAVPTALAGLISFVTESKLNLSVNGGKALNYEQVNERHWLSVSAKRPGLLELFHPSPLLADLDPLEVPIGNLRKIKQSIAQQLRRKLKGLGVKVVSDAKLKPRKLWELLAAIESRAGIWYVSISAWREVASYDLKDDSSRALDILLERWSKAASIDCSIISSNEFSALSELALESPGVVMLRSLRRHWPDAYKHLPKIVAVSWRRFRTYLDKAWFYSALSGHKFTGYPEAIKAAVLNSNLESVLDEHFWYLTTGGSGDWTELLKDFEASLGLRGANVTFHNAAPDNPNENSELKLRSHVAVALTEGRSEVFLDPNQPEQSVPSSSVRSDEIRKAFNSPFWPNVLVTTSIGQEGIDLHPWCSALAHWDLAKCPAALEQREGRITRFASLSVRRAIAKKLAAEHISCSVINGSPWSKLAEIADKKLSDASGMSPWWVIEGAKSQKYFFAVPGSEQNERYVNLNKERALYRLVLGMPDQEDLMHMLKDQNNMPSKEVIRDACIDLSAYNIKKFNKGK